MRLLSDLSGRLKKEVLCILATTFVLQPLPAIAQSFCGPTTLVNFNGINGQYPAAGVIFDAQGNMYGATAQGGPSFSPFGTSSLTAGLGTVWKYSSAAGLTTLFAFSGTQTPDNNGYRPLTPLVMDAQGNLYGTTYYGGIDFNPDINGHQGWGRFSNSPPEGSSPRCISSRDLKARIRWEC